MSLVQVQYKHIMFDEAQVPIIAGTNMKVVELVLEKTAYGWSAEELHLTPLSDAGANTLSPGLLLGSPGRA